MTREQRRLGYIAYVQILLTLRFFEIVRPAMLAVFSVLLIYR